MKKDRIRQLVLTGVFIALVFVGSMIRIILPVPLAGTTSIHLGNIMCVLAGLLLGPLHGGLSAGLGSALYDCTNPLYIAEVPFTFINKLAIGLIVGLIAHSRGRKGLAPRRNTIGAAAGSLVYVALYMAKSFFYNGILVGGLTPAAAVISLLAKLPASLFNGAIAVLCAVPLAALIQAALKHSGFAGKRA